MSLIFLILATIWFQIQSLSPILIHRKYIHRLPCATSVEPLSLNEAAILSLIQSQNPNNEPNESTKQTLLEWFLIATKRFQENNTMSYLLQNKNLLGNYNVSIVLQGKDQKGNPAGGKFRSKFGRFLYQNEGLYQHLIASDGNTQTIQAINFIQGKIFRWIPFSVILKGICYPLDENERSSLCMKYNQSISLSPATVKVRFQSPRIILNNRWSVSVGPVSYVVLHTPYLSNSLRLGLGARGSMFYFTKTTNIASDDYKSLLAINPMNGMRVGTLLVIASVLLNLFTSSFVWYPISSITKSWRLTNIFSSLIRWCLHISSIASMLLGLVLVLGKGGIEDDDYDR